jgi:hypothetical protein
MLQLFRLFLDIALWRKGPQDVPASGVVLGFAIAAYVSVNAAQLLVAANDVMHYIAGLVIDPLLIAGWIWVVLAIFGRRARFPQTVAAIFGTYAILSIVLLTLQVAQNAVGFTDGTLSGFVLAWVIVFVLVTGRIVMLAVDRGLLTGAAVMVTYIFANFAVTSALLPAAAA